MDTIIDTPINKTTGRLFFKATLNDYLRFNFMTLFQVALAALATALLFFIYFYVTMPENNVFIKPSRSLMMVSYITFYTIFVYANYRNAKFFVENISIEIG